MRTLKRSIALLSVALGLGLAAVPAAQATPVNFGYDPPSSPAAENWFATTQPLNSIAFQGQCVDLAIIQRPDIAEEIFEEEYVRQGGPPYVNLNADLWIYYAWWAGLPIGQTPWTGSLVVYPSGTYGGASYGVNGVTAGHIAYVYFQYSDGSFWEQDEHFPNLGQVTYRYISAATVATDVAHGVWFIY